MSKDGKRIYWADTLKGILIVLVVLGHAISSFSSVGTTHFWDRVSSAISAFHMPAFFLISGYLNRISTRKKQPDKGYVWKKVLSLGLPMVIFSTLYWCVKYAASMLSADAVSNPQPVSDLLLMFVVPIGEYWFLYALLLITLLDVLFDRVKLHPVAQGVIWLLLFLSWDIIPRGGVVWSLYRDSILPRVFWSGIYFWLGKVLCNCSDCAFLKSRWYTLALAVIAAICWTAWYLVDDFLQLLIPRIILAMATTLLLIKLLSRSADSFVGKMGQDSLDIYLLHPYALVACKLILVRFIPDISICLILSTLIALLLCYAAMFVISKIKYLDFILRPTKYLKMLKQKEEKV